jgi:hypothetical protein
MLLFKLQNPKSPINQIHSSKKNQYCETTKRKKKKIANNKIQQKTQQQPPLKNQPKSNTNSKHPKPINPHRNQPNHTKRST